MRSEGLDGGTWSAFWLAILGNTADFLSIFFVCDSNVKVNLVPGPELSQLPSKSAITKRTR